MMIKPSFKEERKLWESGISYVIGIDEVGRGAFAGPIVAGAVIYKPNFMHKFLRFVNDSKLLNARQREELSLEIKHHALYWNIDSTNIGYINRFGIGKANSSVFRKVISRLVSELEDPNYFVLIDGFHRKYLPGGIKRQKGIVKGDQKSLSIASASIIAKVYRDKLMKEVSSFYPEYEFDHNKGYGTKFHREAILKYGLTKTHRMVFAKSLTA